jgi:hypothetical protein
VAAAKPAAARLERHGSPIRLAVHQLGRVAGCSPISQGVGSSEQTKQKHVPRLPDLLKTLAAKEQLGLSD